MVYKKLMYKVCDLKEGINICFCYFFGDGRPLKGVYRSPFTTRTCLLVNKWEVYFKVEKRFKVQISTR